jgi:hypothetical protein
MNSIQRRVIFANAGYKLGQWHDVGYWQLSLQRPEQPRETLLLLTDQFHR